MERPGVTGPAIISTWCQVALASAVIVVTMLGEVIFKIPSFKVAYVLEGTKVSETPFQMLVGVEIIPSHESSDILFNCRVSSLHMATIRHFKVI